MRQRAAKVKNLAKDHGGAATIGQFFECLATKDAVWQGPYAFPDFPPHFPEGERGGGR